MSQMNEHQWKQFKEWNKQSFVLIGIDTHPSMFIKKDDDDSIWFVEVLKSCLQIADSLMLDQNKRNWARFGIILANEDDKATFLNFDMNLFESMKFLKERIQCSSNILKELYERKGSFDMGSFFLLAKKKFADIRTRVYKKKFVFITNDDNPLGGDASKRFVAINECKSFVANNIDFQLVTMNKNFNYGLFYQELLSQSKEDFDAEIVENVDDLTAKLSDLIVVKCTETRLKLYPMKGNETRFLKVIKKDYIRAQKIYCNTFLDSDGRIVQRAVITEGATGATTYRLKNLPNIKFSAEERRDLLDSDYPVGLTLSHVSNRNTQLGLKLKPSSLIDFDELEYEHMDQCKGIFQQFWNYCVLNDKVLVCIKKSKKLDELRFVELIPVYPFKKQMFLMVDIPFQDEYKEPPAATRPAIEGTKEQKRVLEEYIERLTFDYHPSQLPDPDFNKTKNYLKAKLLDEPVEDFEDPLVDEDILKETLGDLKEQFCSAFGAGVATVENKKKRKWGRSSGSGPSKKKK